VIEQITKQKLPPGAQSSEFLLEHGMVDRVVHRTELRSLLARLLRLYAGRPAAAEADGGARRAIAVTAESVAR
jgi:acetyl-CoA carboxylase carboxyl transferase subunit beta